MSHPSLSARVIYSSALLRPHAEPAAPVSYQNKVAIANQRAIREAQAHWRKLRAAAT